MGKIKNLSDLKQLQEQLKKNIELRELAEDPGAHTQIKVSMATCGIASGAKEIMEYFIEELEHQAIDAIVTQTGCMGYCYAEPTVEVHKPGNDPVVFGYVTKKKANEIIHKYIQTGELVDGILPVNYQEIN